MVVLSCVAVSGGSKQWLSPLQGNPVDTDSPDRTAAPFHPYQTVECTVKETEGKLNELGQRISAIEKAQLQNKRMILKEQFTKEYMKAKGLKDDPSPDVNTVDYSDSSSPDLLRLMVSQQQMLGQQLTGMGQGLLNQTPNGLMVAFPTQDNIMAGFTPLTLAATAGHVEVEILLGKGGDIEAQSART
ncbi:unnamed protein product, partial [Coregonus sp. 'balchen']